jgi:two-component system, NarL family, response regulator LiaR
MIRVVVCDDQDVIREGLRAIVGTAPGLEVVGVAADGDEVIGLVERTHPDVVLMDLNMPGVTGVQATRVLREKFPAVKVLVLTTYDAEEWVFDAIRAGASGYLLKDAPRADLISAIEGTASGKTFVDPSVAGKLFTQVATRTVVRDTTLANALSERERDVLRLLAQGLTNSEIAGRLFLSEGTIRNYVSAILEKLGVSDRTRAALLAVRHGLVD